MEPDPTYSPEFAAGARLVLLDHLLPRAAAGGGAADAAALGDALRAVRGHETARAAVELAVLDAQLRAANRSLADWLGATATAVPAGAALGLHDAVDDLLAEADDALRAGAARLRVKVAPGRAAEPLQRPAGPRRRRRPAAGRRQRLVLLRRPRAPGPRRRWAWPASSSPSTRPTSSATPAWPSALETPICLDEPLTSLGAVEAAVALGACEVVCLKPARVGGWRQARAVHDRCVQLGVPVWVGGLLETGVGRAANLAVAALPGMALPPGPRPPRPLRPRPGRAPAPGRRGGGGARRSRHGRDARRAPCSRRPRSCESWSR